MKHAMLLIATINFAGGFALAQQPRGICKGDPVPPNKVIVKEYVTDQCPPTSVGDIADPDAPNAYQLAEVRDGLNVCRQQAPVGFFICEKHQPSSECGGHEVYLLASPSSCAISNHRLEGLDLATLCPDRRDDKGKILLPDGYVMVGRINSHFCALPGPENAWIIRRIRPSTLSLPQSRSSSSGVRVAHTPIEAKIDVKTNPAWKCRVPEIFPPLAVITGRFETPNCPTVAPDSNLNGELIDFVSATGNNSRYEVCIDSPIPKSYVKLVDYPQPTGPYHSGGRHPKPHIDTSKFPVHTFNKPACGGSGANAIIIYYSYAK